MILKCELYDIFPLDSFGGHHFPYAQVAINKDMTVADLRKGVERELRKGDLVNTPKFETEEQKEAWFDAAVTAARTAFSNLHSREAVVVYGPERRPVRGENVAYAFFLFTEWED